MTPNSERGFGAPPPTRRDVYEGLDALEVSGAHIGPPPLVLGHRGAPREAPENTLAALRRAMQLGVDGVEYDVRACASGDLVLFHDERLERTTDARGAIGDVDLRELYSIDAGGWFGKRFAGEGIPVLDEALMLSGEVHGAPPFHMIELKEAGLVDRLAECLESHTLDTRVASFRRDVVLAARDAGMRAMLLGVHATEDDRRFVRDERIHAYSVGPRGWRTEAGRGGDWSFTERWAWSIDDPRELIELFRGGIFGLNTNEPHRALAARALAKLAPDGDVIVPVEAPELYIEPETLERREQGEWFGSWDTAATVTNPFPFPVSARASIFVPHGAFELDGVPRVFDLEPHEERSIPFRISGGARVPGPDPLIGVLLSWNVGQTPDAGGEWLSGGKLLFDAPLVRRRIATADGLARRLEMLVEGPNDPTATIVLRRDGRDMILSLENPGELEDAHLVARLGSEVARGGRGLRLRLPHDFDDLPLGVPFTCGIEGRNAAGDARLRRWSGGLPSGLGHGRPGLLLPLSRG